MQTTPITSSDSIRIGTHFGLSRSDLGIGGVYRDDDATLCEELCEPVVDDDRVEEVLPTGIEPAVGSCPGLVPLGVTRPPVLRLGGATRVRV